MLKSALLGSPVRQSFSPHVYKILSKSTGLEDYQHDLIHCSNINELQNELDVLQRLGYIGANITMPYKSLLFSKMDELDESAKKANSINTIKFENNKKIGYNTDYFGFEKAVETQLGVIDSKDRVTIFGNGGAARAIICALSQKVAQIDVVIRKNSKNHLDSFNNEINISYYENTFENIYYLLVKNNFFINATSVGMFPNNNESLFVSKFNNIELNFEKNCKAFDVIFNPTNTSFLNFFKKRNCSIGFGYQMLYFQAQKSLEIWTNKIIDEKEGLISIKSNMEGWIKQIENGTAKIHT